MRVNSGGTIGRIPWDKAMVYGARKGLDDDTLSLFWQVICAMDRGYAHWMSAEFERARRAQQHRPRKSGGRIRTRKGAR